MEEAENERMHLMNFITNAKPNFFEQLIVLVAQGIVFNLYFILYSLSYFLKSMSQIVGYFEEERVMSYTQFLKEVEEGRFENAPAPQISNNY